MASNIKKTNNIRIVGRRHWGKYLPITTNNILCTLLVSTATRDSGADVFVHQKSEQLATWHSDKSNYSNIYFRIWIGNDDNIQAEVPLTAKAIANCNSKNIEELPLIYNWILMCLNFVFNMRLFLLLFSGMYRSPTKSPFFIPTTPELPRAKCSSCPHNIILCKTTIPHLV